MSVITVPLAIFMKGAVLDTAYISYAIRAIGAIVIVTGLYARKLVTPLGVKLAFIIGTISVFITMIAQQRGWFSIDKTYGAVAATLVVILSPPSGQTVPQKGLIWNRFRERSHRRFKADDRRRRIRGSGCVRGISHNPGEPSLFLLQPAIPGGAPGPG